MRTENWWARCGVRGVGRVVPGAWLVAAGAAGAACGGMTCPDGAAPVEGRCPVSCDRVDLCAHPQDASEAAVDAPASDAAVDADAAGDGDGGSEVAPPPRPIAPMSTAYVTSQQPVLRWALASGSDGAQVELCRDRAFTMACQRFDASGEMATVPMALARGVWFWRLRGKAGAQVGTRTGPIWQFTAPARSATVNTSWGSALDVNGDGFSDVVVGAPGTDGTNGHAHVYWGRPGTLGPMPNQSIDRAAAGGPLLSGLASAGDVNGDGYGDLIVGGAADGAMGRAIVFLGSPSGVATRPDLTLVDPDAARSSFGVQVGSAGDVNRDGYGDIVVGAPNARGGAGRLYLYLGSAAGPATSPTLAISNPDGLGNFGAALPPSGDFNGDGYGDIAAAAPQCARGGCIYTFRGGPGGLTPTPAANIAAPRTDIAYFGITTAVVNDLNGDGYADVAAAATGLASGPNTGRVSIFLGGSEGLATTPVTSIDGFDGDAAYFGYALVGLGDVTGDGNGELLVNAGGVATSGGGSGRVYLFEGQSTGISTTPHGLSVVGEERFGNALSGPGDVNGDDVPDALVGAGGSQMQTGRAFVFLGSSGGLYEPANTILDGPDGPGSYFGLVIAR